MVTAGDDLVAAAPAVALAMTAAAASTMAAGTARPSAGQCVATDEAAAPAPASTTRLHGVVRGVMGCTRLVTALVLVAGAAANHELRSPTHCER